MANIPQGLITSIETHNCVLFIGAGVGSHYKKPDGRSAPTGTELCKMLCDQFSITYSPNIQLSQVAELVQIRKGRKELEAFISSQLSNLTPDDTFDWIPSVRWKSIFTTNYDNCIERAYQLNPNPSQSAVSFSITSNLQSFNPIIDVPIYHIHGYFSSVGSSNIIITQSDYAKFREKRKMLFELLKLEMATASILYVGYSNRDTNWEILINEIQEDFYPTPLPQSYRVDPYPDVMEVEILENKHIHTITASFGEFVADISPTISVDTSSELILPALKRNVPPDLLPAFSSFPVPITRLLTSWEYVNQANLSEQPNHNNFLKGDAPNWSLIAEEFYFDRDIQADIYETILEFATTNYSKPTTSIVLGAAGYGTSTLLDILAMKIVKDNAGAVFKLRRGASINEGDVEYAASLFPSVYFIVDDAADYANILDRIIHSMREIKKRSFFLLGEHLNEWHQSPIRPRGQEFPIEPLSDNEINRLLFFLAKNGALNKLEGLSQEVQFGIIKERYQKELLVVMREATEGDSFDAIIENEYRGIGDQYSQYFYLCVCCFYQHGALVRDGLLSEYLNTDIAEMYAKITGPTEGVVVQECIDDTRGIYAARARHHKIAAVVWERCAEPGQKEEIIQGTMKLLNLNYGSDARAFNMFIQSDRMVDNIRSLEGKMDFFEHACKMDPMSPYVRQHYARMFSRVGQYPAALQQIETAINNDQTVRILYHTKGKILSEMALNAPNVDIGRKFLIQAESAFNRCITMNDKDVYGFESLASIYFDWSRELGNIDPAEAATYLSKAEEMISTGLRSVRNREPLWLLSSKINQYLGNTPKSLRLLETAVQEHSHSIIGRYLLARTYREKGQPQDALQVLEPVIMSNTDEFRAFIEYALALLETGESYRRAASVLGLSTLYGLSDARFIAIYGGLLYLDGEFTKADEAFSRSIKHSFPADELFAIHFKPVDPRDSTKSFSLNGEVISVSAGHSVIQVEGYPQILCPASKYKNTIMKRGMRVKFILGFCAKGPVALFPTAI